jgi:DNA polymerase III subunit gamma/tau
MTTQNHEYKVLARKYRPQDFSSLIGQDHVVKTLSNEFSSDKIPHAFIFTGIRGTGKTSLARIIAKALNCIGSDGNNTKPTIKPCLSCSVCTDTAKGIHPDVIEMDAASKTGVDDIREIIENCTYTPSSARNKIYIIDEVHMLSNNAFNALLKTLEEPPSHTKFIFATTEIEKIPLTILSRCQRFDLHKISVEMLSDFLAKIAKSEAIKTDGNSLNLIAEIAGGSVRDALSMLDQVQFLCEQDLKIDQVRLMLGLNSKNNNFLLLEKLIDGNPEACLEHISELFVKNISAQKIIGNLLDSCHILTTQKVTGKPAKNLDAATIVIIDRLLEKLDISVISRIWQMLLKGVAELKIAPDQNKALEMLIIRICFLEKNFDFKTIVTQGDNNNVVDTVKKKHIQ